VTYLLTFLLTSGRKHTTQRTGTSWSERKCKYGKRRSWRKGRK